MGKTKHLCTLYSVSISSLAEKSRIENAENRRKMYSNINKATKYTEPFENKAFLELIDAIMNN
jgi:hypothetical protein